MYHLWTLAHAALSAWTTPFFVWFLGSPKSYPRVNIPSPLNPPWCLVWVCLQWGPAPHMSYWLVMGSAVSVLSPTELCWEWELHRLSPFIVFWYWLWQPVYRMLNVLLNGTESIVSSRVERNRKHVNSYHGSRSRREAQGKLQHSWGQETKTKQNHCFNRGGIARMAGLPKKVAREREDTR